MSKPRFERLGGVMRGQADVPLQNARGGTPPPEDEEELAAEEGSEDEEDSTMTEKKDEGGSAPEKQNSQASDTQTPQTASQSTDAVATARAEERQRIADVFASDDVKGREMAAAELLSASDMKADAIIAMLPKLTPSASADEGQQMLTAMREGADPDLGQDTEADQSAEENYGWGKAQAKAARLAGRKPKSN